MQAEPEEALEAAQEGAASINPRDMSYALSARSKAGQWLVRVTENLTGRLPVLYRLWGYDADVAAGTPIWDVVWKRYGLSFEQLGEPIETIPAHGPVILLSNHPFGILDGMAIGKLLHDRRPDFKIMANSVFAQAPELAPHILPVDFAEEKAAVSRNIAMRKEAMAYLRGGGAVSIFPGGAVSSAQRAFGYPFDPEWKPFAAKLISATSAPVIPVFFDGRNSTLFEAAGRLTPAFRYGLHIHEFWRRIGQPVRVVIGKPIPQAEIEQYGREPMHLMAFLRAKTYALSPQPLEQASPPDLGPPVGPRWP
ncbi:MAG: lysophospholipid acyltransferase family protein [Neomegalonema sp.]|nr:lysophospholipid acyltransferase family protein [Neomegalonema sp.]